MYRSRHPEVFLRKGVHPLRTPMPKCDFNKVAEHRCLSVISIKLQSNFIENTLRHGCSPVNLLDIFRTSFPTNISGWLLLYVRADYILTFFFHNQII